MIPDFIPPRVIDGKLEEFAATHFIEPTNSLREEASAIYWIDKLRYGVMEQCVNIDNEEPTHYVIHTMLERAHALIIGSIVSFVTGSVASAEVTARAAYEAALNIRFILSGDRIERLLAYFNDYVDKDSKEIDAWQKALSKGGKPVADRDEIQIRARRENNRAARGIINRFLVPYANARAGRKVWPSVKDRFDEVGAHIEYYVVYGRMCSQSHASAEDLLSHIAVTILGDRPLAEENEKQTTAFSRMMMYYGILNYLRALLQFAQAYSFEIGTYDVICAGIESIIAISPQTGIPHELLSKDIK